MTWRLQFFFLQKPQLEKVHSLNLQQQAPRKWVETEAHFESIRSNVSILSDVLSLLYAFCWVYSHF